MSTHTTQLIASTAGLLAAGLLAATANPTAATQAHAGPDSDIGDDPGAMVAHRHQQMSDDFVRNAAEPRDRAPAARLAVRTGTGTTTFTLFAVPDEFGTVDTGETGDSLGDLVAFTDLIINRADRPIGHAATACMRTSLDRGESQCTATIVLDDKGSIAVQGIITDADGPLKIPVVGGTGAFDGATGTMTVTAHPSDPDRLRLAFRLLG